jgi:hypothetical protein
MRQNHIRVVHLEPDHCDVHVQVPGLLQVPLFEQVGEQTAKKITIITKNKFKKSSHHKPITYFI